jgi:hypothetical protein
VSDATVIPFRRPVRRGGPPVPRPRPHKGAAIVLQVAGADVVFMADDVELTLTPEQARDLANDLLELADDAEARR